MDVSIHRETATERERGRILVVEMLDIFDRTFRSILRNLSVLFQFRNYKLSLWKSNQLMEIQCESRDNLDICMCVRKSIAPIVNASLLFPAISKDTANTTFGLKISLTKACCVSFVVCENINILFDTQYAEKRHMTPYTQSIRFASKISLGLLNCLPLWLTIECENRNRYIFGICDAIVFSFIYDSDDVPRAKITFIKRVEES